VKRVLVFCLCVFVGVLLLAAAPKPTTASRTTASRTTFESPLPWCEDTRGVQPCTPKIWRPTLVPLASPTPILQANLGQSSDGQGEGGRSSESQAGAMATAAPGSLPPMTLPVAGGESANYVLISIGIMFVGMGVLLVAIRGRGVVQVNLVALLEQVGPHVLGGDERLRLLSIIRNVAPDQVVTIDLSRCAKK
jgi:hypothetical protein